MSKSFLGAVFLSAAVAFAPTGSASAHPHVWVTMKSELVYAPDGSITGIRHAWTFDDMFSVFATQGIEAKKKDEFTREELMPLAKTNVESLKEFDYFTLAKANGKQAQFVDPVDYYLDYQDSVLTLHFLLPLKAPIKAKTFDIDIYDPSYFVDFSFIEKNPVSLVGAPSACALAVKRPEDMDPAQAQRLSQFDATTQLDPSMYLGAQFASKISVKCP